MGCPPGDGPVLHAFRSESLDPLLTIRIPGEKPDSLPIFHPDGSRLAVIGSRAWIIDRGLGTVHESISNSISDGAFSADGRQFVAVDAARRALVQFDIAPPPDAAVSRGVTTHWSGDGTSNDVVGGTHGVTTDQLRFEPGRFGQAFSFHGETRGVDFGRRLDPNLAHDPGTYAAWIKPGRIGARRTILSRTTSLGFAWSITRDGRLSFCFRYALRDLSCETEGLVGRSSLRPDSWHHVAVVRSASGLTLFVDGREDGTKPVIEGFQPADTPVSDQPVLRLGAGGNGSEPFHGLIDEVMLFRRILTANDLAQIMRATWLDAR